MKQQDKTFETDVSAIFGSVVVLWLLVSINFQWDTDNQVLK